MDYTKPRIDRDITRLVERLEAIEEQVGIRLEAISARLTIYDDYIVYVFGEVHPINGTTIKHPVGLFLSFYDTAGRVVDVHSSSAYFDPARFYGLDVFRLGGHCQRTAIMPANLARIRLIPKVMQLIPRNIR